MQTDPIQIPIEVIEGNTAALKDIQNKLGGIKTTTAEIAEKQVSLGKQFKQSWTEINQAIGVARQAYQLLKGAVDATIGTFVTYAGQVRGISQVTGQQAEEVSRLIQVTDDYKIRTESLNTVMRKMATEGMPLTIDALAQLSDKYLKLGSGVERQIFLTETFGRQGVDFAEIMLAGGTAIRAKSAAIQDGLILDQKALDQARDYEIKLDDLTDSVNALKIAAGKEAIPIVIELITKVTTAIGVGESLPELGRQFKDLRDEMARGSMTYEEYKKVHLAFIQGLSTSERVVLGLTTNTDLLTEEYYNHIRAIQILDEANQRIDGSFSEAAVAAGKMAASIQAAVIQTDMFGFSVLDAADALKQEQAEFGFIVSFAKQYETQIQNVQTAEQDLAQAESNVNALRAAGWSETGKKMTDAKQTVEDLRGKLGEAQQASLDATNEMIAGFLQAQLTMDGTFTEEDIQKVLAYRRSVGLLSDEAYEAALNALHIAENLASIPDKTVHVTTIYSSSGQSVNVPKVYGGHASGGSFSGWAMVGDRPGGGITPYTEWVYAPHGAMVYNQSQMSGQSAPPMAGGGAIPIPSPARGNAVDLSHSSMRELARVLRDMILQVAR